MLINSQRKIEITRVITPTVKYENRWEHCALNSHLVTSCPLCQLWMPQRWLWNPLHYETSKIVENNPINSMQSVRGLLKNASSHETCCMVRVGKYYRGNDMDDFLIWFRDKCVCPGGRICFTQF